MEEEQKSFKDAFVGVAEELCGRTFGKADHHHQEGKTKRGGQKK